MKRKQFTRLLSLLLALVLATGLVSPALAAESRVSDTLVPMAAEKVAEDELELAESMNVMQSFGDADDAGFFSDREADMQEDEMVRVSIVLKDASTLDAGFAAENIAENASAMQYRARLQSAQDQLCERIERQALEGRKMDVVWNLTLAANIISANVPRSAIGKIAAVNGVDCVVEETRYLPDVVSVGGTYQPHTAVSGQMTGAQASWLEGYNGAGMRIAVIDTGLDVDHQSFDADAFAHAIAEDEAENGRTYKLMTAADTASVLEKLNAYAKASGNLTAEQLYVNEKVPFGYNYVDVSLDITHDHDAQGEHGSHVAGISAANRYLKKDGAYVDALESVHVAGAAPDAQLLVMKVFGAGGGAYDADIMAGIEDAILLGADSVNLSLGSAAAGTARSSEDAYTKIMDSLTESGLVCVISAGNSSYWAQYTTPGDLYSDGVNFDTVGAPGSYTNALTVASVDNDGMISAKLEIAGSSIVYAETLTNAIGTPFGNASMTTLDTTADGSGTAYPYLFIDGLGAEEDYAGMDLTGKIVFCKRGAINLVEKASTAAKLGAAATVIYNFESGLINMDLSGYSYKAPAVFASAAAGALAKENGEVNTTAGGLTYYTGTVTVYGKETANYLQSEYLSMSSFSSWGVPGDLSLKPEISAPGGSIYSVNGGTAATDQYELMSGTSMAAPQVAGMAALVQQYLRENEITVSGLTSRALTQALLMSTSVPMRSEAGNGNYFPVFQQGSGFANVLAAVQTPVFMTVDGMPDGKVKVELGEDAAREGVYTFRFRLNNLTGEDMAYRLSGDVFTQDLYTDGGVDFLSTNTRMLTPDVDFTVGGKSVMEADSALTNCDFNGDGVVNRSDAQALLDYVTGARSEIRHMDKADLNGDGKVDTYDVYCMLHLYQGYVTVPANGSVSVDVRIALSDADRAALSKNNYPAGAYLEAYIFAAAATVDDGVIAPTLSLPVLGFYGSWTEASMFDVADNADPEELRAPYLGAYNANAVGLVYGDKPYSAYYFGGNPVTPDAVYHPERNAINLERGDYFYGWKFAPVRNAAALRATAVNTTTGEALMEPVYEGELPAAYFYYSIQNWIGGDATLEIGLSPDMKPGEHGELTLTAAPELYVDETGNVDWDALGEGASKTVQFTIDNEAPVLDEQSVVVDTEKNVLRLTAKDDQYLAGAILFDNTGRKILNRVAAPEDAKPGESVTIEIPLGNISGYRFVIQVTDYAANSVTYKLKQTIGTPGPRPTRIYFDTRSGRWFTAYPGKGYYWSTDTLSDYATIMPYAAAAVGSYVYVTGDTGKLYVAPADDLDGLSYVCRLGYVLRDMAYDAKTDRIYGVTGDGLLISFDKMTAATTEHGYIGGKAGFTKTLGFDGEKFYCGKLKANASDSTEFSGVYSFTLDTLAEPELVANASSSSLNFDGEYQTLEYDTERKVVTWIAKAGYYVNYNEIDPAAKTWTKPNISLSNEVTGLFFPDWTVDDSWTESKGIVERVAFDRSSVTVQQGYTAQLEVQVLPWNLSEKERNVTYTSLNPDIATVDAKGVVTGVGVGEATVRVSSADNPAVYADCSVTVEALDLTVDGVLMDATGKPTMYTWNLAGGEHDWEETVALDKSYYTKCIAEIPGANEFYLLTSTSGTMHRLSAETGLDLEPSTSAYYDNNYPLYDMAYSNVYSKDGVNKVYAVREGYLILPFDPMKDTNWQARSMNAIVVGIATGGTEKVEVEDYYGWSTQEYDSEVLYVLDSSCRIHRLNVYEEESWGSTRTSFIGSITPTDMKINIPTDEYFAGYSSLTVGSDGALYASIFDGSSCTLFRLVFDESIQRYVSTEIGSYGKDVWPAALLHVESNLPATTAAPVPTLRYNAETDSMIPIGAKAEKAGGLNAVKVESGSKQNAAAVRVDPNAKTVLVPIAAGESTNGLFSVCYDEKLMKLEGVSYGGMTLHSGVKAKGKVTVGYASETPYTGTAASLLFSYAGLEETTATTLTLDVMQDGAGAGSGKKSFEITLEIPTYSVITGSPENKPAAKPGASRPQFDDVRRGDWFYDSVMEMVELGHMTGISATKFAPDSGLTRAMLVTILYRMDGQQAVSARSSFTDVVKGSYYEDAVNWASAKSIVNGYSATTFAPNDPITRQQMAAILWRYAQYKGVSVKANGTTMPDFADRAEIASWAGEAVSWAYSRGIMTGKSATRLDPNGGATRAEAATMMLRFLKLAEVTDQVKQ